MCILTGIELYRYIAKRTGWTCSCCSRCAKRFERKPKIHKPNLLGIGYTHDGKFDPYHMDFELCCGLFHTERSVKWIAGFIVILAIINCILFTTYTIPYLGYSLLSYVPSVISLNYGVWKRNSKFIHPFIVNSIVAEIALFVSIILIFIAVFNQNSALYEEIDDMSKSKEKINDQLMLLFLVVLFSIDLVCLVYITWIMYIHCCYLQSIETIDAIHELQKAGKYDELEERLKAVDEKKRRCHFLCFCCNKKRDKLSRELTYA